MFKSLHLIEFTRVMKLMDKKMHSYIILLVLNSSILASGEIINAYINKNIINSAINKQTDELYRTVVFSVIIFTLGYLLLDPITRYMMRRTVLKSILEIRMKLFAHVEKLPISYFSHNHKGEIITRLTGDINKLDGIYGTNMHQVVSTLIQGVGTTIVMFLLEWRLALLAVILGTFSSIINIQFAKPIREINERIRKHLGFSMQYFTDILTGINIIKLFNISSLMIVKFTDENNKIADETSKLIRKNSEMASVNFLISFLNIVGIVCIGVFMLSRDIVDMGTLIAIISLQGVSNGMFLRLGSFYTRLQDSLTSAARIIDLFDSKIEAERSNSNLVTGSGICEISNKKGMVALERVVFNYELQKKVVDNISLGASDKQTIALVGPSGGGKSTIMKLLIGFYRPSMGTIIIDNKNIECYTLEELRNKISYVSQDVYLFSGTVEENIRFGKLSASKEEIINAAIAAHAHDFVIKMPEGYNTIIGEHGGRLSGGQKQRIALARAFLKNSSILLLDEATSSLDSESEELIQDAINKIIKERTVIVVAHRLSTIEKADIIYVIDEGKVVEYGQHSQLLASEGVYYKLYHLQFQKDSQAG